MAVRFINDCGGKFKVALKDDDNKTVATLLWGDHVRPDPPTAPNFPENAGRLRVTCRARTGWVPKECVGDEGLLELYVIDVGQGDGVLMRTPDESHELTRSGKPWRRVENLELIRDWFVHYLVDGKRALPPR